MQRSRTEARDRGINPRGPVQIPRSGPTVSRTPPAPRHPRHPPPGVPTSYLDASDATHHVRHAPNPRKGTFRGPRGCMESPEHLRSLLFSGNRTLENRPSFFFFSALSIQSPVFFVDPWASCLTLLIIELFTLVLFN